jgi:hypothetical protein
MAKPKKSKRKNAGNKGKKTNGSNVVPIADTNKNNVEQVTNSDEFVNKTDQDGNQNSLLQPEAETITNDVNLEFTTNNIENGIENKPLQTNYDDNFQTVSQKFDFSVEETMNNEDAVTVEIDNADVSADVFHPAATSTENPEIDTSNETVDQIIEKSNEYIRENFKKSEEIETASAPIESIDSFDEAVYKESSIEADESPVDVSYDEDANPFADSNAIDDEFPWNRTAEQDLKQCVMQDVVNTPNADLNDISEDFANNVAGNEPVSNHLQKIFTNEAISFDGSYMENVEEQQGNDVKNSPMAPIMNTVKQNEEAEQNTESLWLPNGKENEQQLGDNMIYEDSLNAGQSHLNLKTEEMTDESKLEFLDENDIDIKELENNKSATEDDANFDFLKEDDEILLDEILDDDFLEETASNEGPNDTSGTVVVNEQTHPHQPKNQFIQHDQQQRQQFMYANSFVPAQSPVQTKFGNFIATPVATYPPSNQKLAMNLQQDKKKSDAYDFPQDLLAKNRPKQAKEVKQNIYTQIESSIQGHGTNGNFVSPPASLNNISTNTSAPVSQISNSRKFSRTSSVSSSKNSFFAELPIQKLREKKSNMHLKNPYEVIENQPEVLPAPDITVQRTINNPYAPPVTSKLQDQNATNIPVINPSSKSNTLAPLKKSSNPYAPAAVGGHIRQLSTTVPASSDVKPNIIPVPMKSPISMQNNLSPNANFHPQISGTQMGSINQNILVNTPPRNVSSKYAPPVMHQQNSQHNQFSQTLQPSQLPQQTISPIGFTPQHQKMNSFSKGKSVNRNRLSVSSINDVYGSNIVTSNATSTSLRRNTMLPPNPIKGKHFTPPGNSFVPAPVVINPENLVRRQWPLFSFSGEGKVASMVPSFDGYSHNICNIKIIDVSMVLKQDQLVTSFPGPLLKNKTKKKDLIKWLDDIIDSVANKNQPSSLVEELTWKCLKKMLESIEKPGDLFDKEYVKGISSILNPTLDVSGASSNIFDIIELTKITKNFSPQKPYNAFKLDDSGLFQIHKMLEIGDKKSALEFAISEGDWALALLISNLMGNIAFAQTIKLYASFHFPTGSLGEDLSFFIQSTLKDGLSADHLKGKERWLVDNFAIIIPFIMLDNTEYDKILVQIGEVLTNAGYIAYGRLSFVLSGLPIIPKTLSDLPTSIYGMIIEEIYEFILLSTGNVPPNFSNGFPHMIPMKVRHGGYLADIGASVEAKKYCDFTQATISSKQFFCELTTIVEQGNLCDRLSQVGSGWLSSKLSRPQLDRVWTTLDKSFNKFVAGEDNLQAETKSEGVFSKFTSPALLSRTSSSLDLSEVKNNMINPLSSIHASAFNNQANRLPSSGYHGTTNKGPNLRSTYAVHAPTFHDSARPRESSIDSTISNSYAAPIHGKYTPNNLSTDSLPTIGSNSNTTIPTFDSNAASTLPLLHQNGSVQGSPHASYTRTSSATSIYNPPVPGLSPLPLKKSVDLNPSLETSSRIPTTSFAAVSKPVDSLRVKTHTKFSADISGDAFNSQLGTTTNLESANIPSPHQNETAHLTSASSAKVNKAPPPLVKSYTLPPKRTTKNSYTVESSYDIEHKIINETFSQYESVSDEAIQNTNTIVDKESNVEAFNENVTEFVVEKISENDNKEINDVEEPIFENSFVQQPNVENSFVQQPNVEKQIMEEMGVESTKVVDVRLATSFVGSIDKPIATNFEAQKSLATELVSEDVKVESSDAPGTKVLPQVVSQDFLKPPQIVSKHSPTDTFSLTVDNAVGGQCIGENDNLIRNFDDSPVETKDDAIKPQVIAPSTPEVPKVESSNRNHQLKSPVNAFKPNTLRATSRTINRYGPASESSVPKKKLNNPYAQVYAPKSANSSSIYAPEESISGDQAKENGKPDVLETTVGGDIDMFSFGGYSVPPPQPPVVEEVTPEFPVEEQLRDQKDSVINTYKDEEAENPTISTSKSDTDSIPTFKPPTQLGLKIANNSIDAKNNLSDIFTPPSAFSNLNVPKSSSPIHHFTEERRYYAEDTGEYYDDVIDDSDDEIDTKQKEEEARKLREAEERKLKEAEERKKREEEEEKKKKKQIEPTNGWFGWLGKGKNDDRPKPIKAKLGEENSFYYDEKLKRWINKKAPLEEQLEASKAPPPPMMKKSATPSISNLNSNSNSNLSLGPSETSTPQKGTSNIVNGPPTSIHAPKAGKKDEINELLNFASPSTTGRRTGARRGPRRGYVDVMGQQ